MASTMSQAHSTATLGGVPAVIPDIPICAVFLALYAGFAATNMTIFRVNLRRGHKFILSALLFGFCMARITTLVLRIVWSTTPHNLSLAMAANIFVNAGILLVYIINVILSQRILRARQPHIGWNPVIRGAYKALYGLIIGALAMVITSVVISLKTTDPHTKVQCRDVQLAAITYLLVFTCIPLFHLAVAFSLPRAANEESFGQGSMTSKSLIVAISSCICVIIAGFKCGTTWSPLRLASNPAWYHSKACFYVFNFACEIMALSLLTFSRFDKRFYVPNGCNAPGDYTRLVGGEKPQQENDEGGNLSSMTPKTS
ncbi:hypothetical protein BDV59DRAFT_188826 [Aspergillus ambiguus]|uniref:uncharacterized protein n=1 Tax=Aspergillus ambiguus TaxID=176160 RepID=UPI003CCD2918